MHSVECPSSLVLSILAGIRDTKTVIYDRPNDFFILYEHERIYVGSFQGGNKK